MGILLAVGLFLILYKCWTTEILSRSHLRFPHARYTSSDGSHDIATDGILCRSFSTFICTGLFQLPSHGLPFRTWLDPTISPRRPMSTNLRPGKVHLWVRLHKSLQQVILLGLVACRFPLPLHLLVIHHLFDHAARLAVEV